MDYGSFYRRRFRPAALKFGHLHLRFHDLRNTAARHGSARRLHRADCVHARCHVSARPRLISYSRSNNGSGSVELTGDAAAPTFCAFMFLTWWLLQSGE